MYFFHLLWKKFVHITLPFHAYYILKKINHSRKNRLRRALEIDLCKQLRLFLIDICTVQFYLYIIIIKYMYKYKTFEPFTYISKQNNNTLIL